MLLVEMTRIGTRVSASRTGGTKNSSSFPTKGTRTSPLWKVIRKQMDRQGGQLLYGDLSKIARRLGVSRERASQVYFILLQETKATEGVTGEQTGGTVSRQGSVALRDDNTERTPARGVTPRGANSSLQGAWCPGQWLMASFSSILRLRSTLASTPRPTVSAAGIACMVSSISDLVH